MLNIVMNEKFQRIEKKVCMCILQSIYGPFANTLMKDGLKNCNAAMALSPRKYMDLYPTTSLQI